MTGCSKSNVSEANYWTAAIKPSPAFYVDDGFVALQNAVQSKGKLADTLFDVITLSDFFWPS